MVLIHETKLLSPKVSAMSVQSGLLARIKGRSFRRFQPPKRQASAVVCSSWSLEIFALKCPYHCRSSCPCGKPQNSPIDAHLHAHDGFRPRGFLVEKAVESDRRAHAYPGRTPLFLVVKKAFKRVLGLAFAQCGPRPVGGSDQPAGKELGNVSGPK
jgi:hypothetical protein